MRVPAGHLQNSLAVASPIANTLRFCYSQSWRHSPAFIQLMKWRSLISVFAYSLMLVSGFQLLVQILGIVMSPRPYSLIFFADLVASVAFVPSIDSLVLSLLLYLQQLVPPLAVLIGVVSPFIT